MIRGFAKSFLVFTEDFPLLCLRPLTSSASASPEVPTLPGFLIMAVVVSASSWPALSTWVSLCITLLHHILYRRPQVLLGSISLTDLTRTLSEQDQQSQVSSKAA